MSAHNAPALPPGLEPDDLAAAFAAAGEGPLLVALSGGGDSTALLHLLHASNARPPIAAIVDHARRPESAAEAERVAAEAGTFGVEAHIRTLAWPPGATPSQAALRRARYVALCDAARALGATAIAVGHTEDDQRETLLMRGERACDPLPIASLAPAPLWPEGRGLLVTRPLLNARREDLRAWLRARDIHWIEDPSNENLAFERIRARRALAAAPDDPAMLVRAKRASAARRANTEAARLWLAHALTLEDPIAHLRAASAWNDPAAPRALAALLAAVSGADAPPSEAEAGALLKRHPEAGVTLAGCLIRPAADGALRLSRDPGAVLGRAGVSPLAALPLASGQTAIWDGRLQLTAHASLTLSADPAQPNTPHIQSGSERFSLAEAAASGLLDAQWLLEQHISHILFTPP